MFSRFLSSSNYKFSEKEKATAFRFKTLSFFIWITIFSSIYYIFFFYIKDLYREFYIIEFMIAIVFFSVCMLYYLRRSKEHYNKVIYSFLILLLILFTYILHVEMDNSGRHLWFILPIVVSYYLIGRRQGIITTFFIIILLLTYGLQSYMPSTINEFSLIDGISIIILLSICIFVFEKEYENVLRNSHEYYALLEQNNEDLGSKAKSEIISNEKKTSLLIEESRFAQMGKTLSMIAHHWRQPLSSISTSSANIKLSIMLDECVKEKLMINIENIDTHVKLLSETINDFRSFFKSSKHKEFLTGHKIMKDAFKIIQETMTSNGITFDLDLDNETKVYVYKNEMVQAVLNILTNANEIFVLNEQKDARMKIKISNNDEELIIRIQDNAGGVDKDALDDLFDPYYSTKLVKNGTGLGLYISKTIIEEQALGKLLVENKNRGLCFTIKVPRHNEGNA